MPSTTRAARVCGAIAALLLPVLLLSAALPAGVAPANPPGAGDGARYTIVGMRLDVTPVRVARPLYGAWSP